MHFVDLIVLTAYLAIVLFLGYRAGRRSQDTDDYIVAGRSLPGWMLGCTLAATLTGAGMTLGAAGSAYREGASFLWVFFAVAWTDTVQVGLMTLGVVVIGPIIGLREAGGVVSVTRSLHAVGVDLWNPLVGITFVGALTGFALLFLSMSDPTSMQRALAGNSPRDVRNGFLIASFISLIWGVGVDDRLVSTGGVHHLLSRHPETDLPLADPPGIGSAG